MKPSLKSDLKAGVLYWGVPMILVFNLLAYVFDNKMFGLPLLLISLPIFLLGGIAMGFWFRLLYKQESAAKD